MTHYKQLNSEMDDSDAAFWFCLSAHDGSLVATHTQLSLSFFFIPSIPASIIPCSLLSTVAIVKQNKDPSLYVWSVQLIKVQHLKPQHRQVCMSDWIERRGIGRLWVLCDIFTLVVRVFSSQLSGGCQTLYCPMQVLISPETDQTRLWKEPELLFTVVHVLALIVNMQLVRHFVVKVMQMTA